MSQPKTTDNMRKTERNVLALWPSYNFSLTWARYATTLVDNQGTKSLHLLQHQHSPQYPQTNAQSKIKAQGNRMGQGKQSCDFVGFALTPLFRFVLVFVSPLFSFRCEYIPEHP